MRPGFALFLSLLVMACAQAPPAPERQGSVFDVPALAGETVRYTDCWSNLWIGTQSDGVFYMPAGTADLYRLGADGGENYLFDNDDHPDEDHGLIAAARDAVSEELPEHYRVSCFAGDGAHVFVGTEDGILMVGGFGAGRLSVQRFDAGTRPSALESDGYYRLWSASGETRRCYLVLRDSLVFEKEIPLGDGPLVPSEEHPAVQLVETGGPVSAVYEDPYGIVWLGSGGLRLYNPSVASFEEPSPCLEPLLQAEIVGFVPMPHRNELLIATRDSGVWSVNIEDGQALSAKQCVISGHPSVNCVERNAKDDIWVGTDAGVQIMLSDRAGYRAFEPADLNGLLCGSRVNAIFYDRLGNAWMATDGQGVFKIKYDYLTCRVHSSKHYCPAERNMPAASCTCLLEDAHNRVWAGSADCGLCLLDGEKFRTVKAAGERKGYAGVFSVCEDASGRVWAGTGKGPWKYGDKCLSRFSDSSVPCIQGALWAGNKFVYAGTSSGLALLDLNQ